jgi:hypothetical protein
MKKSWIRPVLGAAQEHDVGVLDAAPGAPDLLVVRDDGPGRLEVHDEPEVGLVVAHAQRARRDHGLHAVAEQPLLDGDALLGRDLAAVRLGAHAVGGQERGDVSASRLVSV